MSAVEADIKTKYDEAVILSSFRGQLEARIQYLQEMQSWLFLETTNIEKLKAYVQRRYGFDGKGLDKTKLQKMLSAIFKDYQEIYHFFLTLLEKSPDFDQLYISLKGKLAASVIIKSNHDYFARNKKKEEERVFMQDLLQQLNPLVSPSVLDLAQYVACVPGSTGQSGWDMDKLIEQEINRLFKPVHELLLKVAEGKYNFINNEKSKHHFSGFFAHQVTPLLNDCKALKDELKALQEQESAKNLALMRAGKSSFKRHQETFLLMKDKLFNIRSRMLHFKIFYEFYIEEIANREKLHKTFQLVKTLCQTKIQKYKEELSEIEDELAKKQLNHPPPELPEITKILANINALAKENEELKNFVEELYSTGGVLTIAPLFLDAREILTLFIERQEALEFYFTELRAFMKAIPKPENTEKPASSLVVACAMDTEKSKEPAKKKIIRPMTIVEPMTKERWAKITEEDQKKQAVKKQEKLRAMTEPTKIEIDLKKARLQMRELSTSELKKREERINTSLKKNKPIISLFETLYFEPNRFGHNELMNLIEALRNQGEAIKLKSPSGGSSHYTVVIGNHYGFLEEEWYLEKAKAFKPSDPKAQGFPKDIINSLQLTFSRAGYTCHALGIIARPTNKASNPSDEKVRVGSVVSL